ncbi:hypothetical protein SBV1_1130026 [Verrucomicrobia bacterium]|nr:hypothetical protein SBV1_1130026 [Verrucomicrobiota bacterium]
MRASRETPKTPPPGPIRRRAGDCPPYLVWGYSSLGSRGLETLRASWKPALRSQQFAEQ